MSRYSSKQRQLRGQGKHSGPSFIQLPHHVKRSVEFHRLSHVGKAFLLELIDRYKGGNNGMIVLGVREAAYELTCSKETARRAMHEVDDANLARPTKVGAWRGREATEWRLTWRRCDKTGDLPRSNWVERKPYVQLLLPKPKKEPISDAERARRYRHKKVSVTEPRLTTDTQRHEDRHDEAHHRYTEGSPEVHRRDARLTTDTQNGNSSITSRKPRLTTDTHLHMYHEGNGAGPCGGRDGAVTEMLELKPEHNQGAPFTGGLLAQLSKPLKA